MTSGFATPAFGAGVSGVLHVGVVQGLFVGVELLVGDVQAGDVVFD